jgi:hypothetical protein
MQFAHLCHFTTLAADIIDNDQMKDVGTSAKPTKSLPNYFDFFKSYACVSTIIIASYTFFF